MPSEKPIKIGFLGAGHVNFGAFKNEVAKRPWNHSKRLQQIDAVVDIDVDLAWSRIQDMRNDAYGAKWETTTAFKTCEEMLASSAKPDAVYIGVPPTCHGGIDNPAHSLELQLAKEGIHIFIEKPLSIRPVEEVTRLGRELTRLQDANHLVIAVGYMLRYSATIQVAKELLREHNVKPVVVRARYSSAYDKIRKRAFWDVASSGGPVVEQATHFIDLLRFFGGEIVIDSVKATAVGPKYQLTSMAEPPYAEHEVPEDRRINRATEAVFQFSSGAIGSLSHNLLLHDNKYHTAIEIVGDGVHIMLDDPYGAGKVLFRRPHSSVYEQVPVPETDMFMTQAERFITAIKTGDTTALLSPFADALESYKISQAIAAASNTR